jgi:hypothetical protein
MYKKNTILGLVILLLVIFITGCKEKYNADIVYPDKGYLVVDGFINGRGVTNIKLSRTVKLDDATSIKYEQGATVRVEGDDNNNYALLPQGNGLYAISQFPLNDAHKYRLYIKTSTGKEYRSDFASVIRTPPIDSVSYNREEKGLSININTHDPKNQTWYYTWNYEETWEHRSSYLPTLKLVTRPAPVGLTVEYYYPNHASDTSKYRCWQTVLPENILAGSSKKLIRDEIHLPLTLIPNGSIKLSVLYSIKVYQHGVSERGYSFLQQMKKNTQQVGSIFDSQPSELNTNIRNINDSLEQIIGFVEVADGYETRIFIEPKDVPGWDYYRRCIEQEVTNNKDSLDVAVGLGLLPTGALSVAFPDRIGTVLMVTGNCVDCTLNGGGPQKPSFWPR